MKIVYLLGVYVCFHMSVLCSDSVFFCMYLSGKTDSVHDLLKCILGNPPIYRVPACLLLLKKLCKTNLA